VDSICSAGAISANDGWHFEGISLRSQNFAYQERIDHLRFFAAVLIVLYHALSTFKFEHVLSDVAVASSPILRFLFQGHTAVGLFMTLSGFLFAIICKDKGINLWAFYRNRILRIYPLFMSVLLLAVYLDPFKNGFISFISSIGLLHCTAGGVYYPVLTDVLWTIPVEFQFYILFPLLMGFYTRGGSKYILGLICLAIATRWAIYSLNGSVHTLAYLSIFGRIDQFVIGMLLGLNYARMQAKLSNPLCLLFAGVAVIAALAMFEKLAGGEQVSNSPLWIVWTTIEGAVWGLLIAVYSAAKFTMPRRLSEFLAFLGTLSFSMYVVHSLVCRLTIRWYLPLVNSQHHRYAFFAQIADYLQGHEIINAFVYSGLVVLPIAIAISLVTFNMIEKPFLMLRSKYIIEPGSLNSSASQQIADAS
jgi:peptidoglycan/LPS O-acetylase OafA/YrhL